MLNELIFLVIIKCTLVVFIGLFCAKKKTSEKSGSKSQSLTPTTAPTPIPKSPTPQKQSSTMTCAMDKSEYSCDEEIGHGNLKLWVDNQLKKNCEEFVTEYKENLENANIDRSCKSFESHPKLNRYQNIKCLDKTRVRLQNGKTDYIHASRVEMDDDGRPKRYILTQGPMNETIDDFWQMCYENNVNYIVMLCLLIEGGVEQCAQYLPEDEGEKQKYGNIEVTHHHRRDHPVNDVTWTVLTMEDAKLKNSGKEINHIAVPWWPQKYPPEDPKLAADLILWLKGRGFRVNEKSSIVIHCNNGIGRSATFVALSLASYYFKNKEKESIFEFIKVLREMRWGAIETEEEYVFIYACFLQIVLRFTDNEDRFITEDRVEPMIKLYKKYARKKMLERKIEAKKEKSLKVEPTKDDEEMTKSMKKVK